MQKLAITWLGHSAFRLRTPSGVEVLFDPWVHGQPQVPGVGSPEQGRSHSDQSRPQRSHQPMPPRWPGRPARPSSGSSKSCRGSARRACRAIEPMNQGRLDHGEGPSDYDDTEAIHSSSFDDNGCRLPWRAGRVRRQAGERAGALLRWRHRALQRHEADWRAVQAGHRVPADRRSLHDGARTRPRWPQGGSASGR